MATQQRPLLMIMPQIELDPVARRLATSDVQAPKFWKLDNLIDSTDQRRRPPRSRVHSSCMRRQHGELEQLAEDIRPG